MKYGIIVSDLSASDARKLLEQLSGQVTLTTDFSSPIAAASEDDDNEGVASNGAFDTTGLPWDERIHAGSKKQNADGTWKKRKGVQPVTITQVEAELRASAPYMAEAPQAAPVNNYLPPSVAPHPVTQYPVVPAAPQVPAAPVMQPPAPPASIAPPVPQAQPVPVAPARDFDGMMKQIGNLYTSQRLTDPNYPLTIVNRINGAYNVSNIVNITDIAGNADYVEYAWKCLEVDGNAN